MSEVISEMVGRTPVEITQADIEIMFRFSDGAVARFFHYQDCCETVEVEDVNGDWNDLIGVPLLVADERISNDPPPDSESWESDTWTFYTFRSIAGSVDVRWHGSSNGYYSESVDFDFIAAPLPQDPAP